MKILASAQNINCIETTSFLERPVVSNGLATPSTQFARNEGRRDQKVAEPQDPDYRDRP